VTKINERCILNLSDEEIETFTEKSVVLFAERAICNEYNKYAPNICTYS